MKKIYIIEDDASIRTELASLLEHNGYEADCLTDFSEPPQQIFASGADLILLDITLPGIHGEALLKNIREKSDIPVIMVTSSTSEMDEVLSMSYGADDYITKPYNPTILLLRISAVLKRTARESDRLMYRNLYVQPAKGCLSDGDRELILTKNEMIIFQLLLDKQSQIVSRDELMTALWDHEEYLNDNALTVNISRLRAKLTEFGIPDAIETRKKQGYLLH